MVKPLKELESENTPFKRMYTESELKLKISKQEQRKQLLLSVRFLVLAEATYYDQPNLVVRML